MKKNRGLFIAVEGNDGAGKTTLISKLADQYIKNGFPVVVTREPGGDRISEQIREILLDKENKEMDSKTEALLYAASRRQHLVSTILPALAEGKIVLCDRFLDSSMAYQGNGRNLGMDAIEQINDFGLEHLRPDVTLFLSLPLEESEKRILSRGDLNRLDEEGKKFKQAVREGFEKQIEKNPEHYLVIDASKTPDEVLSDTCSRLHRWMTDHQVEISRG